MEWKAWGKGSVGLRAGTYEGTYEGGAVVEAFAVAAGCVDWVWVSYVWWFGEEEGGGLPTIHLCSHSLEVYMSVVHILKC